MTPSLRRLARLLAHRSIPRRTRLSLLALELRRRLRPRPVYEVPLGSGAVPLTHEDFEVDWASLEWVLVTEAYTTGYADALVVDVGAHKGYFAAFAVAAGASSVVAYEPESRNFALLAERCAVSYADRAEWHLRRAAVSGESGEAELHVTRASWTHALHPAETLAPYEIGVETVRVDAMAEVLADAAERAGTRRVIVKVNTEGEECSIVLGTPAEAWRAVAELFVEVHSWAPCTGEELAAHLRPAGLTRAPSGDPHVLRLRREPGPPAAPRTDPT